VVVDQVGALAGVEAVATAVAVLVIVAVAAVIHVVVAIGGKIKHRLYSP